MSATDEGRDSALRTRTLALPGGSDRTDRDFIPLRWSLRGMAVVELRGGRANIWGYLGAATEGGGSCRRRILALLGQSLVHSRNSPGYRVG